MRDDRADFTTMSLARLEQAWANAKQEENFERVDDAAASTEERVRANKRKISAH
ncbi:hypothetical protein IC762_18865 [Bradyrhizobium genosp. L]|uniref:hypothetical protein n=1 Tax=Bradyrhizobium genosp. L TaxID=83637 RepID=UPI0018A32CFE|nr:hypothetical protein [Bradyrhizobium genosp. L]QPF81865.1 hypothetical protein IC762_18865 [Bradyrhizobium genosp. L]